MEVLPRKGGRIKFIDGIMNSQKRGNFGREFKRACHDPKHKALKTREWLLLNCPKVKLMRIYGQY